MSKYPVIIGRSELIEFPELFLTSVPAKVDTGAYSSAVHAKNIKVSKKGKLKVLSFDLLLDHSTTQHPRTIETAEYRVVNVENSFGASEDRYAVTLKIKLGTKVFRTEFTLTDRSVKTYPILLGRKAINRRFLVDPAKSHIDRRELKRKYNIELREDDEVLDV